MPWVILLLGLVVLVLPFLVVVGFFHLVGVGLEQIGIPPAYVFVALGGMFLGSFYQYPFGEERAGRGGRSSLWRAVPEASAASSGHLAQCGRGTPSHCHRVVSSSESPL